METILLTLTKLRELYDFDTNMNNDQFDQYAIRVQRNSLKSLLGSDLYNDLTGGTPSIDYSALIDPYLYNYLSAAFAVKYVIEGSLFHTNRGNFNFNQDTTQNPQSWQVKQVSENYKQEQNNYANDIIEYLDENVSTYTLWEQNKDIQNNFSWGII